MSLLGSKTTVEECRVIDVNELHREGFLKPGESGKTTWFRGSGDDREDTASIGWTIVQRDEVMALRLMYTVSKSSADEPEKREVDYPVPLDFTECNYGGERPWFLCPGEGCGRRVAKLYKPPRDDLFLCRECHDLTYESSQKSGQVHYESVIKPLERFQEVKEKFKSGSSEVSLRDLYEAEKELSKGHGEYLEKMTSMAGLDMPERQIDDVPPTFEEWLEEKLGSPGGRSYGYYGRCDAKAKTTGERCKQPAVGPHGKCYYHGGAPGSGVGKDQTDRQKEKIEKALEGDQESD